MAHVDFLTTFLDELDDMEAKLRLDNLRHLLGVGKVEGNCRKGGIEGTTTGQTDLTTTTGGTWVF